MNPPGILEVEVRLGGGVGGGVRKEVGRGHMAEKGHIRRNSEEVKIHLKRK